MKALISNTLRNLRTANKLTTNEVGEALGKSGKTISAWENGRSEPSIEDLLKLSQLYHVDNILECIETSIEDESPEIEDTQIFSSRFEAALSNSDISPAELARMLNIADGTISNYRKGKYIPKNKRLKEIAKILNISPNWLLGLDEPEEINIGQKIKQLRLNSSESLETVGDIVGVHKSTVMRWERGESNKITLAVIEKLAEHFNVPISYFLGNSASCAKASISDLDLMSALFKSKYATADMLEEVKKFARFLELENEGIL